MVGGGKEERRVEGGGRGWKGGEREGGGRVEREGGGGRVEGWRERGGEEGWKEREREAGRFLVNNR